MNRDHVRLDPDWCSVHHPFTNFKVLPGQKQPAEVLQPKSRISQYWRSVDYKSTDRQILWESISVTLNCAAVDAGL